MDDEDLTPEEEAILACLNEMASAAVDRAYDRGWYFSGTIWPCACSLFVSVHGFNDADPAKWGWVALCFFAWGILNWREWRKLKPKPAA